MLSKLKAAWSRLTGGSGASEANEPAVPGHRI